MDKKRILGSYTIRTSLNDFVNGFSFSGNERQKTLRLNEDTIKSFSCDEVNRPIYKTCNFLSNNIMRVRAARVVTFGAAGLRPCLDGLAAKFFFTAYKEQNVESEEIGTFSFSLDFYNVWENLKIDFLPEDNENRTYFLGLKSSQFNELTIDDYNIQSKYIGQTFNPVLEMIIDTAGMVDYLGDIF